MIFVTVGMQLPFDRLVKAVDEWAKISGRHDIVFQVGPSGSKPKGYSCLENIHPERFDKYLQEADLVISHAGMGTILKCLELAKPLIIMPRKSDFKEHRSDHQKYTAERFESFNGIKVVENETQLQNVLTFSYLNNNADRINPVAQERLLQHIRLFIQEK